MIVSVPYTFNVHGYEGLRRTPTSFRMAGTVDVKIEELDAERAPLAAEVLVDAKSDRRSSKVKVPYRLVEGIGLMVPQNMDSLHSVPDAPMSVEGLLAEVAEGYYGYENPFRAHAEYRPDKGVPGPEFNPRKKTWDDREEIESQIHGIASTLVVVEGVVYSKVETGHEPVIVANPNAIREWHLEKNELTWIDITSGAYVSDRHDTQYIYRLDEWPIARKALLAELAEGKSTKNFKIPERLPQAKAYLPEAFVLETEATAFSQSLHDLLREIRDFVKDPGKTYRSEAKSWQSDRGIKPVSREAALAYCALTEVLSGGLDHPKLTKAADVLAGIRGIDWLALEEDEYKYKSRRLVEQTRTAVACCERYLKRPQHVRGIELEEDDVIALQSMA